MIEYKYLRYNKAKELELWHNNKLYIKDNLSVNEYDNATILPLKPGHDLGFGLGGAVDSNSKYIEESSIEKLVERGYEYSNPVVDKRRVVYCGYLRNHWGHFLVDSINRLWYFLEYDSSEIDAYVFFVDYGEERNIVGNYKEFFELLGIYKKLCFINKPTVFKKVIIPESSYYRQKGYYSTKYHDIFELVSNNITVDIKWEKYDKIFMSRSQFNKSKSMEFGMEMLDNFFEKNGYNIIAPEKISLSYMIYLIRSSKKIAAISGTLPHNMLFGNKGQTIEIIERNPLNNIIQTDINQIMDLTAIYIDANLAVYPVELAYGPFIYAYNSIFEKFISDNDYKRPDKKYLEKRYYKKLFVGYIREYFKEHGYKWYLTKWMMNNTEGLYEAYEDSLKYFGDYIFGKKPFKLSHYFQWHFFKQLIKNLIK